MYTMDGNPSSPSGYPLSHNASLPKSTPSNKVVDTQHEHINASTGAGSATGMADEVAKEGWMHKKGSKVNMWGERYFILKGRYLYYYLKRDSVRDTI